LNAEDLVRSSNGPSLFLESTLEFFRGSSPPSFFRFPLANPARLSKGGETHNRQKIADGNK
jgi:hypothetical protein